MKYGETDPIKSIVNKLNADILQVYTDNPRDRASLAIPHVDEEDLVAQALLNIQGMVLYVCITIQQCLTLYTGGKGLWKQVGTCQEH